MYKGAAFKNIWSGFFSSWKYIFLKKENIQLVWRAWERIIPRSPHVTSFYLVNVRDFLLHSVKKSSTLTNGSFVLKKFVVTSHAKTFFMFPTSNTDLCQQSPGKIWYMKRRKAHCCYRTSWGCIKTSADRTKPWKYLLTATRGLKHTKIEDIFKAGAKKI